jgi:hypothetical protein
MSLFFILFNVELLLTLRISYLQMVLYLHLFCTLVLLSCGIIGATIILHVHFYFKVLATLEM